MPIDDLAAADDSIVRPWMLAPTGAFRRGVALWAGTAVLTLAGCSVPVVDDATSGIGTAPNLGVAGGFAVLGASTVSNTGPSLVTGDLGVSPGSAVVGFPPGIIVGTIHAADAVAAQAQADTTIAYNDLAGQACDTDLTGQDLGGLTLVPGVYCFDSSAFLTGILTLDAEGDPDAVFVFQMGSTIITASGSSVLLINDGQDCNVFWQVGSSATLDTTTAFVGNILALASITLNSGATLSGRALASTGAVTMDTNTITRTLCAEAATATATAAPTNTPTDTSTSTPADTATNTPTNTPTDTPTVTSTSTPTNTPTDTPTPTPTNTPTDTPTDTPTSTPTNTPTDTPTPAPGDTPTNTPTRTPGDTPTNTPTLTPGDTPTNTPTTTPVLTATATPEAAATTVFGDGSNGSMVGGESLGSLVPRAPEPRALAATHRGSFGVLLVALAVVLGWLTMARRTRSPR